MKPENKSQQQFAASPCPTSPWTDCYQNAPSQQAEHAAYDSDDQRPTRDALSDIYNRENQ